MLHRVCTKSREAEREPYRLLQLVLHCCNASDCCPTHTRAATPVGIAKNEIELDQLIFYHLLFPAGSCIQIDSYKRSTIYQR